MSREEYDMMFGEHRPFSERYDVYNNNTTRTRRYRAERLDQEQCGYRV